MTRGWAQAESGLTANCNSWKWRTVRWKSHSMTQFPHLATSVSCRSVYQHVCQKWPDSNLVRGSWLAETCWMTLCGLWTLHAKNNGCFVNHAITTCKKKVLFSIWNLREQKDQSCRKFLLEIIAFDVDPWKASDNSSSRPWVKFNKRWVWDVLSRCLTNNKG